MDWLSQVLREKPELALFLSLATGFFLATLRIGRFRLNAMVGTLIAGLAIGQVGVDVPASMKSVFFLLFVFAIGFRSGPEFFLSLRSQALPHLALTVLVTATAFTLTWGIARVAGLDNGTAAGLFAGAMTSTTALGAATHAASRLPDETIAGNVATTYALTYLVGLLLVVWFLTTIGPRLMRANLRDASREVQRAKSTSTSDSVNSGYTHVLVRAYEIPAALNNRTVAEVESLWPPDRRIVIERVRRGDSVVEATPAMMLCAGDLVAVAGRTLALVSDSNLFSVEVNDRELLTLPTTASELVLTRSSLAGQTLGTIGHDLGARGIFVIALKRGSRELPFTLSTVIERGDIMSVSGTRAEIDRIAAEVGYAVYPTASTDIFMVAITVLIGGLIGLPALSVGGMTLSLTMPVGVLIGGLTLGQLRSIYPRFGQIPDVAVSLFQTLGLSAFLALAGLEAGPGLLPMIRESGLVILSAATVICLVPHAITILVGYYVLRINPAILLGLCAGAGTSAPALAALEQAAESRVPTLGYGLAFAAGNVVMAISGTLLVLMT